ncbi:hypothetical protein J4471_00950 [Candidatus Woesearchaeota archaeon]|nr:hypothetical protein [Candidatus Woesearchaeota archaeon]
MFKKTSIDLKIIKEKLDRDLVALIQFPDSEETIKALRILTNYNRFVSAYNDDCFGLQSIEDLELLFTKKVIYRITDIKNKY